MNEILFEEYQFQAVLRVNGELKFSFKLNYRNMDININEVKKLQIPNTKWQFLGLKEIKLGIVKLDGPLEIVYSGLS
jgi:hypothetical protein